LKKETTLNFRLLRDPVWYTNLVAALVMFASTFFIELTIEQQGTINGVALAIAGIVTAWKVSDGQLALVVNLFKALIAVALAFGLHLTDVQQLVIMTLVTAVGSGFIRTQVGAPVPPPASTANPVTPVGGSPLTR
jgi:hypothetical protein